MIVDTAPAITSGLSPIRPATDPARLLIIDNLSQTANVWTGTATERDELVSFFARIARQAHAWRKTIASNTNDGAQAPPYDSNMAHVLLPPSSPSGVVRDASMAARIGLVKWKTLRTLAGSYSQDQFHPYRNVKKSAITVMESEENRTAIKVDSTANDGGNISDGGADDNDDGIDEMDACFRDYCNYNCDSFNESGRNENELGNDSDERESPCDAKSPGCTKRRSMYGRKELREWRNVKRFAKVAPFTAVVTAIAFANTAYPQDANPEDVVACCDLEDDAPVATAQFTLYDEQTHTFLLPLESPSPYATSSNSASLLWARYHPHTGYATPMNSRIRVVDHSGEHALVGPERMWVARQGVRVI